MINYNIKSLKINFTYITFLFFILISCNNIPKDVKFSMKLAGGNKGELQAVIDYYRLPKDSLKLKAAYFLIGNMSNKFFQPYSKPQKKLLNYIDSLYTELKIKDNHEGKSDVVNSSISSKWEELKEIYPLTNNQMKDVSFISSKLLIENIDYAFEVWERVPWSDSYTFEEFCEYVLPYRTRYDIPVLWRKKINKKYSWVLDSIKDSSDFLHASKLINDSLNWEYNYIFEDFPQSSIIDVQNINRGICRQHTSLKIAALRSIGIPVADVSGLQSTTWAIVPDKTKKFWGWEDIQPPLKESPYIDSQRYIDYPKIYEYSYKIQEFPFEDIPLYDIPKRFYDMSRRDITKEHTDFANVSVELNIPSPKKTDYVFLCVFNKFSKKWEAAHWSEVKNNKATFDQMGLGCAYLPMYYSNRQYFPAGDAFYLNKKKKKVSLKVNTNIKEVARVYRKCYLKYWDNRNSDIMINDVFEGANNKDFKDAKLLFLIDEKPINFEERKTITEEKFRYIRYRTMPTKPMWIDEICNDIEIAEIGFYDEYKNKLVGNLISSKESLKNIKNAFDDNIRTNFGNKGLCWIGLDLKTAKKISTVKYLFRNSFNTVEPGNVYELFYWDDEWKSLGKKKAIESFVEYTPPKHALLWLQNITKGREESLFFMEEGKQKWVH